MTSIDHGYSAEFDALISTFATTFGNDVADELESADELELATALRGALAGDSTAANFAVERAHGALKRLGAWPTPAWCECYVLAQLRRCAELLRSGDALEAQRALDMTLIFGAPSDALAPAVRAVESLYFSVVDARTSYVRSSRESGLLFPNEPPASKASDDIDRRLIERVEDAAAMSVNDFKRYYSIDAPVVLANLGKDWRALSTWDDLEWWRLFHGHRSVPLELGGYEDAHWREDVKTIARFVNEDLAPSLSDDPGTSHVAYLAQHQLVDQLASLREDFLIPTICLKSLERINVWMGTAGTVTPCHFDTYDNLLGQVAGYKLVRIYEVTDTPYMYRMDSIISKGRHSQGNFSAVAVEDPDLKRFPEFAKATAFDVILGPGDFVFIPARCWHYVRSLTASISLNFWF